jgi:hypothetical protein
MLPYVQPPSPIEDRNAEHQIVLKMTQNGCQLAIACNCTHGVPIAAKPHWEPGEPTATWREFHKWTTPSGGSATS